MNNWPRAIAFVAVFAGSLLMIWSAILWMIEPW